MSIEDNNASPDGSEAQAQKLLFEIAKILHPELSELSNSELTEFVNNPQYEQFLKEQSSHHNQS